MAEATYGGFWIRALAYSADMSIVTLVLLVLAVPLTFMGGAGAALYSLIAFVGPIAYFAVLTASDREATFGKQLCGLKVQHAGSGEGLSLMRSIGRELAKFVSAAVMMIGFLMVAFTGRKQGLHDLLASTEVVREGQSRIVLAILVALAGVGIPLIVIPLLFGALFAGMFAALMGDAVQEVARQSRPVPQIQQKAAPSAQAPAAQPAPKAVAAAPAAPAASGEDDPESVYSKFHAATLASDIEGVRKWGSKQQGDEIAAASAVERKVMVGLMAQMVPKTYKVTSSEISADGRKALLRLSMEQTVDGKTETAPGTALLVKEGGAWKVEKSIWGGAQPPSLASQGAAPAKPTTPEAPKPAVAEPPRPMAAAEPKPAVAPVAEPAPRRSEPAAKAAAPVMQQSKPPCVYKPVMTDEEIARCR